MLLQNSLYELSSAERVDFTIRCVPTAQQRPKHMRTKTGKDITYKSDAQKANENTLEALLLPYVPKSPFSGGIELQFIAFMPLPLSESKKRKEAMLNGHIGHTVKPDLDNLCKQLKDAMTRLRFWNDDRQVVRLICEKAYSLDPCWKISVRNVCEARKKP